MLIVLEVGDIKQMEVHIADPLVPEPGPPGVQIATEKLKTFKSLSTYKQEVIHYVPRSVN
jgi:hypothetical protein